ncbi:signal transduction histidine kinase [Maribacter sp. MAR_2009_72]|nr:signal transduction histidine kinase [Maribacter sp. MAR_2009_72]
MWTRVLKMLVSLYLPLFALTLFLYFFQKDRQINQLAVYQNRAMTFKKNTFMEDSYTFLRDTHYWATLKYPNDFDPMNKHKELMQPFINLIKKITDYDQFRFIDLNGQEIFRAVRYSQDSLTIGQLQNKKERDYVQSGLNLKKGQLYLSQISLNRENGVIEEPKKAVVRTVAPIFTSNNEQIGLVVINFKVKRILDQLKSKIVNSNIFLLDSDDNVISATSLLEDVPYESENYTQDHKDILGTTFVSHEKDTTYIANDHIWTQLNITLNHTKLPYGASQNDSIEIISPTNFVIAQETPPSVMKSYLKPVYESLLTFNFISILVLLGFSYVYQKNRGQKEQFYLELKEKNKMLLKSKDQLQENNVMVTEMNNSLEIRNKQLSDFNYLISHNLRAPVTSMSLIVEMINKEKNPEVLNQLLPKLDHVAKSITNLTQDINEYVSILDNKEIKLTEINVPALIHEVKHDFTETLLDNGDFEVKQNFEAWEHLTYSKFYLQSILHNFISNAIKYRRKNVSSYIMFKSAMENNKKVLYVEDNGIGLNLDQHGENVFKLYKRFHRNVSGKGMGLFLVKSQLEALNATIQIESEEGKGTKFKLIF